MILMALALQTAPALADFPDNVAIDMRYDCHVVDASAGKRVNYWAGDYVFMFPAGIGLVDGKSIPYLHTLADGRSYFDAARIAQPDPAFGPSFGFALRLTPDAAISFTSRGVEKEGQSRVRGRSRVPDEGSVTELSGRCRVWSGPVMVGATSGR